MTEYLFGVPVSPRPLPADLPLKESLLLAKKLIPRIPLAQPVVHAPKDIIEDIQKSCWGEDTDAFES